jgi:hypothetical protein
MVFAKRPVSGHSFRDQRFRAWGRQRIGDVAMVLNRAGWPVWFNTLFVYRLSWYHERCSHLFHLSNRHFALTIIPGVSPDGIRPSGHLCQSVGRSIVSHTASHKVTEGSPGGGVSVP